MMATRTRTFTITDYLWFVGTFIGLFGVLALALALTQNGGA